MLDISTINKRYFNVKIGDLALDIEPPKLKVLRRISHLARSKSDESVDELTDAVEMILNKNKNGYKVPPEVIDELDTDQMNFILRSFFEWLSEVQNSPN